MHCLHCDICFYKTIFTVKQSVFRSGFHLCCPGLRPPWITVPCLNLYSMKSYTSIGLWDRKQKHFAKPFFGVYAPLIVILIPVYSTNTVLPGHILVDHSSQIDILCSCFPPQCQLAIHSAPSPLTPLSLNLYISFCDRLALSKAF